MIEKLERHTRVEKGLTQDIKISCPPGQPEIVSKINELVDVVNALVKANNIHEKQIDELQMKLEPHKCEPAENGNFAKNAQDPAGVATMSKDELVFRLGKSRERNEILYECLKIATCALKQIRGNGVTSTPWQQDAEKALSFIDKYYGIKNITKGGDNE